MDILRNQISYKLYKHCTSTWLKVPILEHFKLSSLNERNKQIFYLSETFLSIQNVH